MNQPTIFTLGDFTAQQVFDFIVTSVIQQGKPSTVMGKIFGGLLETMCAYRGDEGRKCAAGFLLPDEVIPKVRNHSMDWFGVLAAVEGASQVHNTLVYDLQVDHDYNRDSDCFIDAFKEDARATAKRHLLSPAILDTLPLQLENKAS